MEHFTQRLFSILSTTIFLLIIGLPAYSQPFELDGNATVSDFDGTDWNVVNESIADPGGDDADDSVAKTGLVVDRPEPTEAQFTGGGSKDQQDIPNWKWRTGNPNDKANITNAYAAAFDDNGDFILVFGIDRHDTSGDAQLGFWFLQDDVQPVQMGSSRTFSGVHMDNDLLVLVNFSGGGTIPTIEVFQWQSGAAVSLGIGGAVQCSGGDIPAGQSFCGITNDTDVTAPWAYDNKDVGPTNMFPPGAFFEGAINLTQALGTTACFTNFLAESRTSTSITATLKDFASPSDGFNVCSISVDKACTNPRLNSAQDMIIYDIAGTVTNDGFGTVHNVALSDSPPADGSFQLVDCGDSSVLGSFPLDSLPGGTDACYLNTITVPLASNGGSDMVTVTANTALDLSGIDLTDDATAQCPNLQVSPALAITKDCTSAVALMDGKVVAEVNVTGTVCNVGDTNLSNVTVTDDKAAGQLLSGITLVNPADPADPGATDGACADYSGSYVPSEANDQAGSPTTDPSAVIFKDTATVTGNDIFGVPVESQSDMAECPLCP